MAIRSPRGIGKRVRGVSIGVVSVAVMLLSTGRTTRSWADAGDPEALRRDLIEFAEALSRGPASESALALRNRVATADADTMQELAEALGSQPGWPAARDAIRSLATPPVEEQGRATIAQPGGRSKACTDLKLPASTGVTFGLIIARGVFELVSEGLHAPCDIVPGPANTAVCIAAAIADAVITGLQVTLDESDLCDGEVDSLARDAAILTQNGIATQLDAIETKVDASGGAAQRTAERQLERQLRACEPLVSLVLPAAFGGGLEEARDLVAKWVHQAQLAAVGDVPEATKQLQLGNRALEVNQYRDAFRNYCRAYRALAPR